MTLRASAFILAAGLGTRISALSRHRPKPLLPVGDTTAFAHAASQLHAAGITRIVANASHLAAQIRDAGAACGVAVVEEVDGPLGTAGGLAACANLLGFKDDSASRPDVVVLWNGDIFSDFAPRRLVDELSQHPRSSAVLAVSGVGEVGVGNVGVDVDGRVVRLRAQAFPSFGVEVASTWFSALHAMRLELATTAPTRGGLIEDVYLPALARGAIVRTIGLENSLADATGVRWYDIGDLDSYLRANLSTLGARAASIGVGATVAAGVAVDRAVVGAGAIVDGDGALREVVVWPGARVTAPCARAVAVDGDTLVHL